MIGHEGGMTMSMIFKSCVGCFPSRDGQSIVVIGRLGVWWGRVSTRISGWEITPGWGSTLTLLTIGK